MTGFKFKITRHKPRHKLIILLVLFFDVITSIYIIFIIKYILNDRVTGMTSIYISI